MVDIRRAVLKRKLGHALASAVKLYASEASSEDQRSIVSGQIRKRTEHRHGLG
jgi:hypothetical protein